MKKRIALILILLLAFLGCKNSGKEEAVERKFTTEKTMEQQSTGTPEKKEKTLASTPNMEQNTIDNGQLTMDNEKKEIRSKEGVEKEKKIESIPKNYKTKITNITKGVDNYEVTFDNLIVVKNVRIENNHLIFPYSTSGERKYYFIWANEKELLAKFYTEILNNKVSSYQGKPVITGIKIKKYESSSLKGWADVELDNEFTVKSIPIFMGGRYNKNNIGEPAVKVDGKYVPMVTFKDKIWKNELQEAIFKKYSSLE
jgi:DNA-binding cell septation regulator SpoVG